MLVNQSSVAWACDSSADTDKDVPELFSSKMSGLLLHPLRSTASDTAERVLFATKRARLHHATVPSSGHQTRDGAFIGAVRSR
jgi:hypothetical protein